MKNFFNTLTKADKASAYTIVAGLVIVLLGRVLNLLLPAPAQSVKAAAGDKSFEFEGDMVILIGLALAACGVLYFLAKGVKALYNAARGE